MAGTNVVVVDRGNNTTCSINLLGATVVSWRVNNVEQLCVSDATRYDQRTEIVGGIQIIFPHYGYWKFGPWHGFARRVRWNIEKAPTEMASGDIEVIFSLRDTEYTKSMWNFPFLITYRLILREKELRFYVAIKNTSDKVHLTYDFLLLNYIKIPDCKNNEIIGLYRGTYYDNLKTDELFRDTGKFLTFDKEIDRIYAIKSQDLIITNMEGVTKFEILKINFPNVLVWRPSKKKMEESSEYSESDYVALLCLGIGSIDSYDKLRPGCTFEANIVIKFVTYLIF